MMWNHKLALHIADASWGEIRRQLTYKTDWYGKELVVITRGVIPLPLDMGI